MTGRRRADRLGTGSGVLPMRMSWFLIRLAAVCATLLCGLPAGAQDLTYDDLRARIEGPYASLTSLLAVPDPAPACDRTLPGRTFAILAAADTFGPQSGLRLAGSARSADLLAEALMARNVAAERILRLTGDLATRQGLAHAMASLLPELNCTDMVVLYLTGVMTDLSGIATLLSDGLYPDDWISPAADSDPLMRAVAEAQPVLLLNGPAGAPQEFLTAAAMSDLLARLRNRTAHVTLILDTNEAEGFDIARRQFAVDARQMWRGTATPEVSAPAAVTPGAGALTLLYGADRSSMAAELPLPEGSPGAATFGLFSFRLAAALAADRALTAPSLGRALASYRLSADLARFQNHVIEATDPALPILAELAAAAPDQPAEPGPSRPDVIRITAPALTRAATALDTPAVTLKGVVDWPEETLIVLVNREQALSRPAGEFQHDITLEPGLNRIEIVALTRDNRQHTAQIEIAFDGDPAAALAGAGRRYALLIANQTYGGDTGMPALATPFADVDALAEVLQRRFGFSTSATLPDGTSLPLVLKDATRAQIEAALFQLSRIAGEADDVLVWYGGHGVFEQVTDTAFWVPADAVAGVPPSYVSASGISEALLRLQAGSVIVISDSCYSGALLRSAPDSPPQDEADRARMLQRLAERRSRVLMTSGANEPVADGGGAGHSVFARAVLTALAEVEGPVTARELFDGWVLPIVAGRAEQEPQFRPIARAGHEGGDFVFVPQN